MKRVYSDIKEKSNSYFYTLQIVLEEKFRLQF